MILGMPLMQLVPVRLCHQLQSASICRRRSPIDDPGVFARSIVAALKNSELFRHRRSRPTPPPRRARLLQEGKVAVRRRNPGEFLARHCARRRIRDLLIEADATDPAAGSLCAGRLQPAGHHGACATICRAAGGARARRRRPSMPCRICSTIRNRITQYNIVPGLLARHPHHDHGADDLPGADARARARHLRKSARHAGDAAGDHDRQDRALCRWSARSRAR